MNITLAKGSGEYCICESILSSVLSFDLTPMCLVAHILAPGAHARMPLVDRISPLKIPVTFVCTYLVPSSIPINL